MKKLSIGVVILAAIAASGYFFLNTSTAPNNEEELKLSTSAPDLFVYPADAKLEGKFIREMGGIYTDGRKVEVNVYLLTSEDVEEINLNLFDGINLVVSREELRYEKSNYVWQNKDEENNVIFSGNIEENVIIGTINRYILGSYTLTGFPEGYDDGDNKYHLLLKVDPAFKYPPD